MLKGNAYGHGIIEMARAVIRNKVDVIAVATLGEAMELRRSGVDVEIITLGYTPLEDAKYLQENNITQTVFSKEYAVALNREAIMLKGVINCEIKLDTGMKRIGFACDEEGLVEIREIAELPALKFRGIYSHFATADEETKGDIDFAKLQMSLLQQSADILALNGVCFLRKHICNSSGTIRFADAHFDYCRSGSLVIGLNTAEGLHWDLLPAGALKACVTMIKTVKAGESVSYCRTYFAKSQMLVASLSCGYADGYPRSLSNKGKVEINGVLCPVVGTVCMDQMMIDVTNVPNVKCGDVVTLYGASKFEEIGILPVAKLAGSVYVELMTRIGARIPRVYVRK